MAKLKMTRSTGNVFEDLGFDKETAENLRIRSALMIEIEQFIRRRRLTQAQAAKLLGVSQPRVSDLVRGKIGLFTIDMLVNMLSRAGRKVVVQTTRAAKAA
jgi:predicted XRE-type DNA-binding protein